jgi:hypothetical protein
MQICKNKPAYLHTRWITIGTFWQHFVFIRGSGFPDAIEIHWRGRFHVFQPWQFLNWEQVTWAVRRRLELSGLRLVSIASGLQTERYVHHPLQVQVARDPVARRHWRLSSFFLLKGHSE